MFRELDFDVRVVSKISKHYSLGIKADMRKEKLYLLDVYCVFRQHNANTTTHTHNTSNAFQMIKVVSES